MPFGAPLRFTIHRKLWFILIFFLVIMAVSAAATYVGSVRISSYLASGEIESLRHAVALKNDLNEIEQLLNDAAAQHDADLVRQAEVRAHDFENNIGALESANPLRGKECGEIRTLFREYFTAAGATVQLLLKEPAFSPALAEKAEKVRTTLPALHGKVEEGINAQYADFEKMVRLSTKQADLIVQEVILLLSVLAFAGFVLVYRTIRSILTPIDSLLKATKELGKGNLDIRTGAGPDDEVGELAASFNDMADRLQTERNNLEESHTRLAHLLTEREAMQAEIVRSNEELQRANMLLQKADKAKSEFLASMSHELRTPLNAMINFTDQVIEDWDELETSAKWRGEAREMLQRVLGSSRHLLDLINDLLDLAKIESGKMTLDLEKADLAGVVEDCVLSLASLAKKKNIPIIAGLPPGGAEAVFDRRKIKQVVINLLSNAIKFTDAGDIRVTVKTEEGGKGHRIIIADSGIGIPEEYHGRIFDRFQQVDGSDSRKHAGTGLGLNLVKELTEMHGGRVELRSAPGQGTEFIVVLPELALPA